MASVSEIYRKITRRKRVVTTLLALSLIPAFLLDLCVGPTSLPCANLLFPKDEGARIILLEIRLPVVLASLLAGASLALAGSLMQTILNNPLASPYTLGISSGAAFGAALAYVLNFKLIEGNYAVAVNAFAFATLTSAIVFGLSKVRGLTSESLILAGIAVSYLFHSALAFLEFIASEEALQAVVFWTFGSLYKATWPKLINIALILLPSSIVAIALSWRLSALRLGDDVARSYGVDPSKVRLISFLVASLLTSITVCYLGIIAFVGLVAPHLARLLVGDDQRFLIVNSILFGSLLLTLSDLASKSIIKGAIIPIGIVTSFVGVPFFLFLMLRGEKGA